MTSSLTRRVVRAAGWRAAKRLIKATPVIGSAVAIGLVGYEVKKKGLIGGLVHTGLDAVPFVGTAKNLLEIYTGDLIADKDDSAQQLRLPSRPEKAPDAR